MPNIFISYRREETAYVAATIAEKLVNRLGKNSVFLDIDNIPMGVDFRKHLGNAISRADLVLVLIGQSWLSCTNEDGTRRLDSSADFVRIEIEAALKRGIPIVPILLGNARMPRPEDLPESMSAFAFRNATELRPGKDFLTQLQRLVEACEKFGIKKGTIKPQPVTAIVVPDPVSEPQLRPQQQQSQQPQLQPLLQPKPLQQPQPDSRRRWSLGRMIYKSVRFVIWMDRPNTFFAKVIRAAFLAGAVFVAFLSVLFGYAVYMAGTLNTEEQLAPTTNVLYSLLAAAYPWLPLYLFLWLPGRLVQLLEWAIRRQWPKTA